MSRRHDLLRPLALSLVVLALGACASKDRGGYSPSAAAYDMDGGAAMAEGAPADASASASEAEEAKIAEERPARARPAARLTAGVFDDAKNPGLLAEFAARLRQSPGLADLARELLAPPTIVTVVDAADRPVVGARVHGIPTGTDGRAVLPAATLGSVRDGTVITIEHAGQQQRATVIPGSVDTRVRVAGEAPPIQALDLALVIDATGSMGDELAYLTAELGGIVDEIATAFPQIDQRWALVVYRDHGDAYVSRSFDFTGRLAPFQRHLSAQQAGGGGDYPEAMDHGLEDAAALSWRDGAAARVLFLIADAPPHAEEVGRTMSAVRELAGQGVGVYPVAASGVAEEAELVMRAAALETGGQYLFLTDDSGIGNSHAEPHIPCYVVESLRDAMVRMIVSELRGHRVEVDPSRTLRAVGRGQDGVCERPAPATLAAGDDDPAGLAE